MNITEKDDPRSLKREKLRSFLVERRSQKDVQATARKETARRLVLERRARLVSERIQARQRKEALRERGIKSQVKVRVLESDKTASLSNRPKPEIGKVFKDEKIEPDSGEEKDRPFFSTPAGTPQRENRQKFLSYLEKRRVRKSEITAEKIKQKEAAIEKKQARQAKKAEFGEQKQSLFQPKMIIRAQDKTAGATISALVGQSYKREQLLAYLKKRKTGEKTFAVQRSGLKKIAEGVIPEVPSAAVVPEPIPVVIPMAAPPVPLETAAPVPATVSAPIAEKPSLAEEEKATGRRLRLSLRGGKKTPSAAEPTDTLKAELPLRKPFKILPFLKANLVKIIFILLLLGWFAEMFLLNRHLGNVSKQFEEASVITKPHLTAEGITTAIVSPSTLPTTRVEGTRDPFSNELWRIQEIAPSRARSASARAPAPPTILKLPTPILVIRPPEFTPPEVAKAIPESAKLTRIPQITVPQVEPSSPVSGLRFRGILNVAGIDYFFVEDANGGYRVRIGDTADGFKIYDYRDGVLYLAKDGNTYQLSEERTSPSLRYRGRMIMAGQEYFFLEGQQRTYRVVIGEEVEGYQLVKRVSDYLYFIKDGRLYYLKQE